MEKRIYESLLWEKERPVFGLLDSSKYLTCISCISLNRSYDTSCFSSFPVLCMMKVCWFSKHSVYLLICIHTSQMNPILWPPARVQHLHTPKTATAWAWRLKLPCGNLTPWPYPDSPAEFFTNCKLSNCWPAETKSLCRFCNPVV